MSTLKLSQDQALALKNLLDWFKSKKKSQFITLGGYAGTGKTTLISKFRHYLNKENEDLKVAFISYTGKATRVLKNKLIESSSKKPQDYVGTIHSLIYSPITDNNDEIIGWEKQDNIFQDLIIIDEASMVSRNIWTDLLTFQKPIIAVGDHGQLPPIRGSFNLMENPQLKLEQIHRQVENNPIIKLSIKARKEGKIPIGRYGEKIEKIDKTHPDSREKISDLLTSYNDQTLVLCGYNNTRIKLNKHIRNALGFRTPLPKAKDIVICLKNNHEKQIYNGMIGKIYKIRSENKHWYYAEIEFDRNPDLYKGFIFKEQFNSPKTINFTKKRNLQLSGDLFDFGYALTVHKAQGSQAQKVVLFEQRFKQMDDENWKRWLYTAVTRAEEELYIIGK